MMTHVYNHIVKYFLLVLVASVMIFAPFSPTFQYQNVEAGGAFGTCADGPCASRAGQFIQAGLTTAGNAINSVTAWATSQLGLKEFVLDGFAWYAINIILEEMIRSVTAWVNAGFPAGGPAFVQDLGGFLLNIADGIAGDFILNNTNLGFMCSPFQLDIQFALTNQYLANRDGGLGYQPQCRISSILQNIKNFTVNVNGQVDLDAAYDSSTFAAGGWAWWMGATEVQENNVFGAYAKAQAAMNVAIRNAKGEEVKLLDFGQGFLSHKKCDANGKNCQIVTPGQVIESQLNEVLAGGQKRLTVADEINELIGALLSQLVKHVLGSTGLFGVSQPFQDPNTGTSYNSLMDSLSSSQAVGGFAYGAGYAGGAAIGEAQSYITLQDQIIQAVDNEEAYLNYARSQYPGQISVSNLPSSLITARSTARSEKTRVNGIINQVQTLQNSLSSITDPTQQQATIDQINTLASQLPTASDTAQASQIATNQIYPAIQSFRATVDADIRAAGGTPTNTMPTATVPTLNVSASPNPGAIGGSTTVTWTVSGADSCFKTAGWSGTANAGGGSSTYAPITAATTTLGVSCTNQVGTTTKTVVISAS